MLEFLDEYKVFILDLDNKKDYFTYNEILNDVRAIIEEEQTHFIEPKEEVLDKRGNLMSSGSPRQILKIVKVRYNKPRKESK